MHIVLVYSGSGTVAPLIRNLVISWRLVVSLRPRPPYPQGKTTDINWVVGWVSPRPDQNARRREKSLGRAGNRTIDRAARNPVKIPNESSRILRIVWTVLVRWRGSSGVPHHVGCDQELLTAVCQRTLYMKLVLCRWTLTVQCDRQHLGAKHTGGQSVASQQRFNSFTGAFGLQALKLLGRLLTSQRSRSGQCMICRTKSLTAFCFALIHVMFQRTTPHLMQSTCRLVARIRIILKWSFSYLFKALWSIYVPPV
jgi:hypothetical protein